MRPPRRYLLASTLLSLTLGLVGLRPADARGQQLLTYNFSVRDGNVSAAAPGISGGEFGRDPNSFIFFDYGAGRPAPDANNSGWTMANAPDLGSYHTFTLSAVAPMPLTGLSLDAARFDSQGINDGPTRFTLRSSLNNFATDRGGVTLTAVFTPFNLPRALVAAAAAAG